MSYPTSKNYIIEQVYLDGWTPANETWTYISPTEIGVPSGALLKYQSEDKLRYKQGGSFKYQHVVSVTDTVLTVTGGTDFTVANATITDNYYSHVDNPIGFPKGFNFEFASVTADASMTVASVGYAQCRFSWSGGTVNLKFRVQMTLGGTASAKVYLNGLPIPLSASCTSSCMSGFSLCLGETFNGGLIIDTAANNRIMFTKIDNTNFTLGAGKGPGGFMAYESA